MIEPIRMISPTACLGLMPCSEDAFAKALDKDPHMIGVDAGSLDPGPYYLGAGLPHVARSQAKRELHMFMKAVKSRGIPLFIGTAGGSGGRRHVEWNLQIIQEVAAELKQRFRVAVIDTTLDKDWLRQRAARETIQGCQHDGVLTPEDVDACVEIVGQIGVEPYIKAIRDHNPDIVLAGRSCDNAIFAALPVLRGYPKGLALHLGKILECGGLCLEPETGYKSVIGTLNEDNFTVEPADPDMHCTLTSVASHAVYERADPSYQNEPGGALDMRGTSLERVNDRLIRIRGSKWVPADTYLLKLEGSEKVGYRSIFIGGAHDPVMIAKIDEIVAGARADIIGAMARRGLDVGKDFHVTFRIYGKNGVMGIRETYQGPPPHELGVILDVVAGTQELAEDICYYGKNCLVWCNFEGRVTTAGNLAYPYSPTILNLGEVYRLRVHHLLPLEDPAFFPINLVTVGP
jgi:hypothetical protein